MAATRSRGTSREGERAAEPAAVLTNLPVGQQLETAITSVARGLRRGWANVIAHTGLAPHQARALRVLSVEGPMRPGALADRLRVTPRSVTEVVDVLIRQQLLTREPDPTDRRAMILDLTDAGWELVDEVNALRTAHTVKHFDAALSRQEQAELAQLLTRLADTIRDSG